MAQTAGAYRSLLRQNFPYFEPGQLACDTMGVPNKLVHFFEILIKAWHDGCVKYLKNQGLSDKASERMVCVERWSPS